jgi:hypothetical protein
MSSTRPPMIAGPISRNFRLWMGVSMDGCAASVPVAPSISKTVAANFAHRLRGSSERLCTWLTDSPPAFEVYVDIKHPGADLQDTGTRRRRTAACGGWPSASPEPFLRRPHGADPRPGSISVSWQPASSRRVDGSPRPPSHARRPPRCGRDAGLEPHDWFGKRAPPRHTGAGLLLAPASLLSFSAAARKTTSSTRTLPVLRPSPS